ncbi:MAG: type II secretion system protein [Phycisphaerae bacterium]
MMELLVVTGIISLLLAITVPALNRVRNIAKSVYCSSQMRQIAIAIHSHSGDNNQQITKAGSMPANPNEEQLREFWLIALLPYFQIKINPMDIFTDSPKFWICPVDKDPYPEGFGVCSHGGITSYALNGYIDERIRLGPAGGYKLNEIKQASSCMLIAETSMASQIYDAQHSSVLPYNLSPVGHHRATSGFYHNNSMNVVYADGHASSIKGTKTDVQVWPVVNRAAYQAGQYMYWSDLTLPSAREDVVFWGPGY